MKKFVLFLLIAVTAVMLTGCGGNSKPANPLIVDDKTTAKPATDAAKDKKQIALVMKTLTNPFFIEMETGARKAEKEFNINLIVKAGAKETSIDQQISIVEELIRAKTDAIVIAPGSSTELIPVLARAQQAGIKIVNIDNRLDPALSQQAGLINVPFISVDNVKGAYQSAKYISDRITTPTAVAVLEGIRTAKNAEDRKTGALQAFSENSNITVVATETANWKIDEAYDVTKAIYNRHPNIGAWFCANDMMALGTIKYLADTGKTGIPVAGYDALAEARKVIGEGKMAVTIDQQADVQGYTGVSYALKLINGQSVPPETLVDVKLITQQRN